MSVVRDSANLVNAAVSSATAAANAMHKVLQQVPLGVLTANAQLSSREKDLVRTACAVAENAYIPRSNYPVGSAIFAENANGQTRIFRGCNVENKFLTPTICAERNAATTAIAEGFTKFLSVAVFAKKHPGGSPCGLCRQMLVEFGAQAVLLNISDHEHNVHRATVSQLLPAAKGTRVPYELMDPADKVIVDGCLQLRANSYVPYSRAPRAAVFSAHNERGESASFTGVSDDNASYGGSATAECVAMRTARTAGYCNNVTLITTVTGSPSDPNPIDGEALQVLREFGLEAKVLLIGEDGSAVRTTLCDLLPDSFGPQSLG